jgi:hypothetical protein
MYHHHERRIRRQEKANIWMDKRTEGYKSRARKTRTSFFETLGTIYRDGKKANAKWEALEEKHGMDAARKLIKEKPHLLGKARGHRSFEIDTPARKKAKKALRYLFLRRDRFRHAQLNLESHRQHMVEGRKALKIAIRDFELLKGKANVPYELKAILRDRIKRRNKALSRVSYAMIRESTLAEDRKHDLFLAHRKYKYRQMQLDKEREFFGRGW